MADPGRTGAGIRREGGPGTGKDALLEEIRETMGLPWTPFPWEVYARQPAVLGLFWGRLSEAAASEVFLRESLAIAGSVHLGVSAWFHPSTLGLHPEAGGDGPGLSHALDAFEFGYPQLLILQSALVHLLRGLEVGWEGNALPRAHPSPYLRPGFLVPGWDDLDPHGRAAARELQTAWGLPHAAPEILALAKWPRFLDRACVDLRAARQRPEYRTWRKHIADMGEDALTRLRPRTVLPESALREALRESNAWPGGADRLKDQVQHFTLILPGLVLDNALLRMAAAAWTVAEEAYTESP